MLPDYSLPAKVKLPVVYIFKMGSYLICTVIIFINVCTYLHINGQLDLSRIYILVALIIIQCSVSGGTTSAVTSQNISLSSKNVSLLVCRNAIYLQGGHWVLWPNGPICSIFSSGL